MPVETMTADWPRIKIIRVIPGVYHWLCPECGQASTGAMDGFHKPTMRTRHEAATRGTIHWRHCPDIHYATLCVLVRNLIMQLTLASAVADDDNDPAYAQALLDTQDHLAAMLTDLNAAIR